jgi:hypothetical protein
MNPQDDPEARIRALEPTEISSAAPFSSEQPYTPGYAASTPPPLPPPTQQWTYPSPYQSQPYGTQPPYGGDPYAPGHVAPYPAAPRSTGSGVRASMVIVPLVVIFLALAGGAAVYWMYRTGPTTAGSPGISGGGGVLTGEPAVPSLPIQIPTDTAAPPADAVPEPGTTLAISGIGGNRTVTCNDTIIIISGANNTVDITGHCIAITVSGFENIVTAESTQEIAVSGFDNKVTYRSGTPTVSESGTGNTITQG